MSSIIIAAKCPHFEFLDHVTLHVFPELKSQIRPCLDVTFPSNFPFVFLFINTEKRPEIDSNV